MRAHKLIGTNADSGTMGGLLENHSNVLILLYKMTYPQGNRLSLNNFLTGSFGTECPETPIIIAQFLPATAADGRAGVTSRTAGAFFTASRGVAQPHCACLERSGEEPYGILASVVS